MSPAPLFGGVTYDPALDKDRIAQQLIRVFETMKDGTWRTLQEIALLTGDPPQSISARLRDFRKAKFGGFLVLRQRRPGIPGEAGVWEYLLLADPGAILVIPEPKKKKAKL
jgi:hypothetical protein